MRIAYEWVESSDLYYFHWSMPSNDGIACVATVSGESNSFVSGHE